MRKIYFHCIYYLIYGCFFIIFYFQQLFLKNRKKAGNNFRASNYQINYRSETISNLIRVNW